MQRVGFFIELFMFNAFVGPSFVGPMTGKFEGRNNGSWLDTPLSLSMYMKAYIYMHVFVCIFFSFILIKHPNCNFFRMIELLSFTVTEIAGHFRNMP